MNFILLYDAFLSIAILALTAGKIEIDLGIIKKIGIGLFIHSLLFWRIVYTIEFSLSMANASKLIYSFCYPLSILIWVGYVVGSIGILKRKKWGQKAILCVSGLMTLLFLAWIRDAVIAITYRSDWIRSIGILLPLVPFLLLIIFLTRPKTKEQFKQERL